MKQGIQGQYAGAVSRGIGFLIDLFVNAVTVAIISWLVTASLSLIGINLTDCPAAQRLDAIPLLVCNASRVGLALFAGVATPVYALTFWTLGGQTLGDAVMGIRVVRADGAPMDFFTSLRRVIGFGLCLLTMGVGFLLILVSNKRQGLHDLIAGTCVIYAWRGEQDESTIERMRALTGQRRQRA